MSRNGSGAQNGNGNGAVKHAWDLKKGGILWKKVIEHSPQAFQKVASELITQLQASVQPVDALEGLLLDRIAASYLRKQLLLEIESTTRLSKITEKTGGNLSPAQMQKVTSISVTLALSSPQLSKYEALLDQSFHRDLMLLMKLKEIAPVPDREDGRPPKSERGLIEGGSIV